MDQEFPSVARKARPLHAAIAPGDAESAPERLAGGGEGEGVEPRRGEKERKERKRRR